MPVTPEEIRKAHSFDFEVPKTLTDTIDSLMIKKGIDPYGQVNISLLECVWIQEGITPILDSLNSILEKDVLKSKVNLLLKKKIHDLYINSGWNCVTFLDNTNNNSSMLEDKYKCMNITFESQRKQAPR